MTDATSLRDRRRIQTEQDIQSATVRLALRHGYAKVTTELIAVEAGISLRTFFNYYANKDAALTGSPPVVAPDMAAWFHTANGPLIDDLFAVLRDMLQNARLSRETTQMIGALLERSPELLPTFHASLDKLAAQLADMITARVGPERREVASLAAALVAHAMANAFLTWSTDASMNDDDILGATRQQIREVWAVLR